MPVPTMVDESKVVRTTKIKVQYVNKPRPGKKAWTIKDFNDVMFFVRSDMADVFHEGDTYEIDYTESEFPRGSGQVNLWVDSARSANGESLTPERRPVPPPGSPLKAYSKLAAPNGDKDADISTLAIFKSLVEGGAVKPSTAKGVAAALDISWEGWLIHKAHRGTFRMKASDELNDEIPD